VRSDVVPQLDDGVAVLERIDVPATVELMVLTPNLRGLQNAIEHRSRFHEVAVFLSASETHNRKNVNRTVDESLADLEQMIPTAREAGLVAGAAIATSFGCPYEGQVPLERVDGLARRLAAFGATEICFGDTTGMANPRQVYEFFAHMSDALPDVELTAHFHNTRGQALANVLAALEAGCTSFESSFGELGGCPVPPGSTGNVATEDLVSMLHEMGVETGIDLDALVAASRAVQGVLGRPLTSHVLVAGPVRWA
jgi:hydroxymethylglutaryl-CoA lyase